jgi:membrane-associated phospholipid phosphatase
MATYGVVHYDSSFLSSLTNPYAAMPSCHFGWSLLIGIATIRIARAWWLKITGALLPSLMLVSILATGNHFILDAVGGAIVIGLAYGIVRLLHTLRERVISPAQ